MKTSRLAITVNAIQGKIASILGYLFAVPLAIGLLLNAEDFILDPNGAIGMMVIFVLSIVGILKGSQIKRRIKRFKRYVFLISTKDMTSIEALAGSTGKPVEFVKKDLQKMMDKRFFARASIDEAMLEIIIGGIGSFNPADPQAQTKVIACQNCGAKSKAVNGQVVECAYCGSFLQI